MTRTLSYTEELVVDTCWCGINHAIPKALKSKQEEDHRNGVRQTDIYCPLGHAYVIAGKGEAERLREQMEQVERRATSLISQLDQEKASHAATKGQLTKTRKRVANGVCPCCNRSFVQLSRHMKTQHPDFKTEARA